MGARGAGHAKGESIQRQEAMPVTMSSRDFTAMVRKRGEFDRDEEAEQATRATLETLGERVSGGQAQDMAAELPELLGGYLTAGPARRPPRRTTASPSSATGSPNGSRPRSHRTRRRAGSARR